MGDLRLFLPITKVDQAKRLVYGVAADETPDAANEVMDYARSKPHWEAWSADVSEVSDGKSKGNVREQHGPIVAGKLTAIHFDDAKKAIQVAAKIVDDSTWRKVKEGVLTGFSVGGQYGARWKDPDDSSLYRYEAIPYEVSVVDVPANPSATFDVIKSNGEVTTVAFKAKRKAKDEDDERDDEREEEQREDPDDPDEEEEDGDGEDEVEKADKRTKRVAGEDVPASAFAYVGDPERTATWKLPIKFSTEAKTESHIRNALARFDQTEGIPEDERAKVKAKIMAAAKRHGIDAEKSADERLDGVEKALARLLEQLEKGSKRPVSEVRTPMDLEKAHSAHKHLEKLKDEIDRHDERHERHVEKAHELIEKCMKALGSGPAEDEDENEDIAEGPDTGGDIEEGMPKRHEKAVTKADLQKAVEAAFEAGIQTVATLIKGQAAPSVGIGDRNKVVVPVSNVAAVAEPAESDATLAKRYAAGDMAAGVALMKKAKPSAMPERAMAILGGRR